MANGVPVIFISVGEDTNDGGLQGFLDIMNVINAQTSPPNVSQTGSPQDR